MAILISGIGLSGITIFYNVIGKALLAQHKTARCVYEPYLWNSPQIESSVEPGRLPSDIGQLSLVNMAVHCNTPLFLNGRHMLHDGLLNRVFGPVPSTTVKAPDNVLVKVIRGSGRLEGALTRFDNLKVVIITRNVVDTVNNSLGDGSLFGDEFHPSDRSRFIEEVNEQFAARLDAGKIKNEIEWSVLWWHYFTLASIRTYKKYPDRVMLVPYEKYLKDRKGVMGEIFGFCGIGAKHLSHDHFGNEPENAASVAYLDKRSIELMNDELGWYFSQLKNIGAFFQKPLRFYHQLMTRYSELPYEKSPILEDRLDRTTVSLRALLNDCRKELVQSGSRQIDEGSEFKPITVAQAACQFGDNSPALAKLHRDRSGISTSPKMTLGVLVTSYNNRNTIEEAICSVLMQSKAPDLIVVADDCSTDGSQDLLKKLAGQHKNIQLVLRPGNVGVAANRDLAVRNMDVDYITTLDGDDLYLPGKLELEFSALGGSTQKVAFSDFVLLRSDEEIISQTSAYALKTTDEILQMVMSRPVPVPRDMMFPKTLFEAAEGYDVVLQMYEDWALKIRLMIASGDCGWVWSGGAGTVYDRRSPGMSGKPPAFHAHWQLLALARNVRLLKTYPKALLAGLRTVAALLPNTYKERMNKMLVRYEDGRHIEELSAKLGNIWNSPYLGDDVDKKREDILRLLTE